MGPTGCKGKAFSIEMHHKSVPLAGPGDNVGINTKSLPKDNMPRTGDVMLKAAQPDKKAGGWKGGFTPNCHVRTAKAPCCMTEIKWKMANPPTTKRSKEPHSSRLETKPRLLSSQRCQSVSMPMIAA